jgi:aspartate aminotransferase-like enzyme
LQERRTVLKTRLFTPGPTPLPPEVLAALAQPMTHHRWPECAQLYADVRRGLGYALQTENEILIMTSSGTGAMEAAVANLHGAGDAVLVVRGGNFGDRWAKICRAFGLNVISVDVEWGRAVDPQQVADHLKENDITAVYATLCETSTGLTHDLEALSEAVAPHPALLVVDAVSGLCVERLQTDKWGIDVVTSATQKGLMCPPGISFVSLSQEARERMTTSTLPKFYWDFATMRQFSEKDQTPFTPGITVLYGLRAALHLIQEEGLVEVQTRHARLARICRAAMKAMGLKLFAERPANGLTAVHVPPSLDGIELQQRIFSETGAMLAGGQAHLRGKILRLAHMGYADELDVIAGVSALETGLRVMGVAVEPGAGLLAAQKEMLTH